MRRLLLSLVHELGSGRALENARRDHDEIARTMAIIDALAGRIEAAHPVAGGERVAA